jgi:hypothetical protein
MTLRESASLLGERAAIALALTHRSAFAGPSSHCTEIGPLGP